MVSSFDPHSMCKNVERVTTKTGCTSCTKRTICFEISGFHTETRLLQQAFQMNYEKVKSWHGIITSSTQHVQESREGYGKNQMHFMYKTDNLFRSIRVSYGNSSVTKGFHFLNLFELLTFCVFKMHHSKPHHHFSILSNFICYFSCIY